MSPSKRPKQAHHDFKQWHIDSIDLMTLEQKGAFAQLQRHPNDWLVHHARPLFQERAANGHEMSGTSLKGG